MKLAYKRKRKEAEETGDEDFLAKVMQCFEDLSDFGLHALLVLLWCTNGGAIGISAGEGV